MGFLPGAAAGGGGTLPSLNLPPFPPVSHCITTQLWPGLPSLGLLISRFAAQTKPGPSAFLYVGRKKANVREGEIQAAEMAGAGL